MATSNAFTADETWSVPLSSMGLEDHLRSRGLAFYVNDDGAGLGGGTLKLQVHIPEGVGWVDHPDFTSIGLGDLEAIRDFERPIRFDLSSSTSPGITVVVWELPL